VTLRCIHLTLTDPFGRGTRFRTRQGIVASSGG
jgi:hypothetical protein